MTELEFDVTGAGQAELEERAAEQIAAFLEGSEDRWEAHSIASWAHEELTMLGATRPYLWSAHYVVRFQPRLRT